MSSIIKDYHERCGGAFEVQHRDNKVYIHTKRFIAEPLWTEKSQFADFEKPIQDLFNVTFADPDVVKHIRFGEHDGRAVNEKGAVSEQYFEAFVQGSSKRWSNSEPFGAAFLIKSRENADVVGLEVIQLLRDGVGQAAYMFSKNYHRDEAKNVRYVGCENVGALIWGYGAELFTNKAVTRDRITDGATIEAPFTRIETAALTKNPASVKILDRLMCKVDANDKRHDDKVEEFVLNYAEMCNAAGPSQEPFPPALGGENCDPEDADI